MNEAERAAGVLSELSFVKAAVESPSNEMAMASAIESVSVLAKRRAASNILDDSTLLL
jgi:hypothetical protein